MGFLDMQRWGIALQGQCRVGGLQLNEVQAIEARSQFNYPGCYGLLMCRSKSVVGRDEDVTMVHFALIVNWSLARDNGS